jgi:polysaccharide deacetylase family protein (PEP-CTERM system associated)
MNSSLHALSVDVEDWNNSIVLYRSGRMVPPQAAVVTNTVRMLELFEKHGARATWFVLGEVADAFPSLVRKLADAGHEIGVHGYHHHVVHSLQEAKFREFIGRAKDAVEQAGGKAVLGYRATDFSITKDVPWAFRVLGELGFKYDSSIFPFKGRRYGVSNAPLGPYRIHTASADLTEVPLAVVKWGPLRLPCCGGGYLRHFPLAYTRWAMRVLERQKRRAVIYVHPYEIDLEFDRDFFARHLDQAGRRGFSRMRYLQYRNRHQTEAKLRWLLSHYSFGPLAEVFEIG